MLRMPDPQGEHQPVQTGSAPEQLAWGWLVPRMYLALWELWRGLGVALGWLWGRNRLAINTLCRAFDVALGGLARPLCFLHFANVSQRR